VGAICIDPDVAAALPGSLVCDMALAEVPNGHLRPVGALHLVDVRNVAAVFSAAGIGVRLDCHSCLIGWSW
jgi:hypothetical protein